MNIVNFDNILAIKQTEFNFLEIRPRTVPLFRVNETEIYGFDLVINYSDNREYVVFSVADRDVCEFRYYAVLCLSSEKEQRGILELSFKDKARLSELYKSYTAEGKLLLDFDDKKLKSKLKNKYRDKIKQYITVDKYVKENNNEE